MTLLPPGRKVVWKWSEFIGGNIIQKHGQFSSAKVHRSVSKRIRVKEGVSEPQTIEDYDIPSEADINTALPGLVCEVYDFL